MYNMQYPPHLSKLIYIFKKLPGIGTKSAERFAFHLISNWRDETINELSNTLKDIKNHLKSCPECGALIESKCIICSDDSRNQNIICLVASQKDIFSIEKTRGFQGLYHVLGALFSPITGTKPSSLVIEKLKERIVSLGVKEVILALDSTLEGDSTSVYIQQQLSCMNIKTSRLAFGIPVGSSLEVIDEGTLSRAISGRCDF